MNQIEIRVATGNKFDIPNQRIYQRTILIQHAYRDENNYKVTFGVNEKASITDFFSRINALGGSDSYFIHFKNENKWIESRDSYPETDLVENFVISDEDKFIDGDIQYI